MRHPAKSRSGSLAVRILIPALFALTGAFAVGHPRSPSESALDDYVHQFESSYRNVRTLKADFTQTYEAGGRMRRESGTVYFARGGLMRWDYRQPMEKLFVSDGKKLVLYVPEEKQVTQTPVKESEDIRVPFRLLLSRLNLRRVFSKIEFADGAWEHASDHHILRATPKSGYEQDYREVLIELDPYFNICRLRLVYPDEGKMEFTFDHLERNATLGAGLFKFVPPRGAEIIEQK